MSRVLLSAVSALALSGCATLPSWMPGAGAPAATTPTPMAATPHRAGPQPGTPHLIVTLSVDQLGSILFNQYRGRLAGGLNRLSEQGRVYQNGYQAHALTETCPGHSTILTGANPERTGIPANDWTGRADGREVYCLAAPQNTLAHGRNTDNGPVGPDQMRVDTLGDWLQARSPDSRVVAVSGKDRGAITLAGHHGKPFWYTDDFGFTTYVEPGQTAADRLAPVAALNARIAARLAANPVTWTYTNEACRALEGTWTVSEQTFRSALPPANLQLDTSPTLDELTLEAATDLLDTQQLGQRGVVDMLGISLSATDRVGHQFGQQGPEMCEQMHRMDTALGAFLDRLAEVQGGVILVLTADHGGSDVPERMAEEGHPLAGRLDAALMPRINADLRAKYGLGADPLVSGGSGLMIAGKGGVPLTDAGLRARIGADAVEALRAHPQIAGAWTLEEIMASPMPAADASPDELTLLERQRLSAVPGRSADILVVYTQGLLRSRGRVGATIANHGSPWDYDRRVPIIFWSPAVTVGQERPLPIRTIDIAPTLANVIGVPTPDTVQGRCIDLGLFADAPACPSR